MQTKAVALGVSVAELKSAIDSWSRSVLDTYELGLAALYQGQYEKAVQYISKSITASGSEFIERYVALARAEYELGEYAEAESALRKVLSVHKDDPNILNNLGFVWEAQGKYDEAEAEFDKALKIVESDPSAASQRDLASVLNNKAHLYTKKGKYKEAEALYDKVLAIQEQAGLRDDPDVAVGLSNLAAVYFEEGRYTEAEALTERPLGIDQRALGPDDLAVAKDLNTLALVYQQQNKYEDAELRFKRAIAIFKGDGGFQARRHLAQTQTNLAGLYVIQHRYGEAEKLYLSALKTKRDTIASR